MSFNLRYYFSVSDNKQRNYNSMSGPPSKFVVVDGTCASGFGVCCVLKVSTITASSSDKIFFIVQQIFSVQLRLQDQLQLDLL